MIRPGTQSKFITKVLDGVEVRAVCEPVMFFHTKMGKLFLYGPGFVLGGIVKLRRSRAIKEEAQL